MNIKDNIVYIVCKKFGKKLIFLMIIFLLFILSVFFVYVDEFD